eukprot:4761663-Pleurochrysis_carterae.AAC.1
MNLLLLACADPRGTMEYQLEKPNASGLHESGKASNREHINACFCSKFVVLSCVGKPGRALGNA